VWQLKESVLQACFAFFDQRPKADPLVAEFERFVHAGGRPLEEFALFETIAAEHPRVPWHAWPLALREPNSTGASDFARHINTGSGSTSTCNGSRTANSTPPPRGASERSRLRLLPRSRRRRRTGRGRGLGESDRVRPRVSVGAPPDPFSTAARNWNLPPPNPQAILASDGSAFRELLAANMRMRARCVSIT
jgi:4-alpha-glucanotransferase